jgi:hypothetical protein
MPLTYKVELKNMIIFTLHLKVLTNQIGSFVMNGYSKIDDNTFPNMMALLSGYKVRQNKKSQPMVEFR